MSDRAAGLLLHPTSLPGVHGIGDLGPAAERFLGWAQAAGMSVWQVLPLGPTGVGNSPYNALSAFAGNPLLVSAESLADEGLLARDAVPAPAPGDPAHVDFADVAARKTRMLRASWEHFRRFAPEAARRDLETFEGSPEQVGWLEDWTLYVALKERQGGRAWLEWDEALRRREPGALEAARRELADERAFHRYVQFLFFRQWARIRQAARARGIRILGDLPIYVALDSADVWSAPEEFHLDGGLRPTAVAGVPPDYFSETGQLWGNPLYRWDRMQADGFSWWVRRMRANARLADLVRLDHFRGFAAYWEVPAGEPTAVRGRWVPGPGEPLFETLIAALPGFPIVAEDLGLITPDVDRLRRRFGFPGMKILQFAFEGGDSDHLPHRLERGTLVYTGTHDNDTSRGWYRKLPAAQRDRVLAYLGGTARGVVRGMIRAAYTSVAWLAVVPLQDVLELGADARMNTPGEAGGNWTWRAVPGDLTEDRAAWLRELTEVSGRLPG